ncbi:transcriptional regulator [Candidatus Woesearchaeota archaeon CG10_big_fil_rev_8_21_14_0_10_34_8]|nr:MAG: transcriptional regulator [Candidatus Woesearchaeota archaeon CG10_big_fil_rev_8_21_14_0_10_34_8]
MKSLLWYLIAGTKGGVTRGRIIKHIKDKPSNTHKISKALKLDYKTVQHHLKVLEKNNIIYAINKGNYGAVYFVSEQFDSKTFSEIWGKFGN